MGLKQGCLGALGPHSSSLWPGPLRLTSHQTCHWQSHSVLTYLSMFKSTF